MLYKNLNLETGIFYQIIEVSEISEHQVKEIPENMFSIGINKEALTEVKEKAINCKKAKKGIKML